MLKSRRGVVAPMRKFDLNSHNPIHPIQRFAVRTVTEHRIVSM
jgi:hypothetical protein